MLLGVHSTAKLSNISRVSNASSITFNSTVLLQVIEAAVNQTVPAITMEDVRQTASNLAVAVGATVSAVVVSAMLGTATSSISVVGATTVAHSATAGAAAGATVGELRAFSFPKGPATRPSETTNPPSTLNRPIQVLRWEVECWGGPWEKEEQAS